jgi:phosphotransferase system HPr-like phosphotransfer protein
MMPQYQAMFGEKPERLVVLGTEAGARFVTSIPSICSQDYFLQRHIDPIQFFEVRAITDGETKAFEVESTGIVKSGKTKQYRFAQRTDASLAELNPALGKLKPGEPPIVIPVATSDVINYSNNGFIAFKSAHDKKVGGIIKSVLSKEHLTASELLANPFGVPRGSANAGYLVGLRVMHQDGLNLYHARQVADKILRYHAHTHFRFWASDPVDVINPNKVASLGIGYGNTFLAESAGKDAKISLETLVTFFESGFKRD